MLFINVGQTSALQCMCDTALLFKQWCVDQPPRKLEFLHRPLLNRVLANAHDALVHVVANSRLFVRNKRNDRRYL